MRIQTLATYRSKNQIPVACPFLKSWNANLTYEFKSMSIFGLCEGTKGNEGSRTTFVLYTVWVAASSTWKRGHNPTDVIANERLQSIWGILTLVFSIHRFYRTSEVGDGMITIRRARTRVRVWATPRPLCYIVGSSKARPWHHFETSHKLGIILVQYQAKQRNKVNAR